MSTKHNNQGGPSDLQPAVLALAGWVTYSLFMLANKFPWSAYLISGLIFLALTYFWSAIIHKLQPTTRTLIGMAAAFAIVLLGSMGIYLL